MKPTSKWLCFIFLPADVGYHEKEGIYVTEDFLGALTERMGLHYRNEATGMAAMLPSFTPVSPHLLQGIVFSPIKVYSVFFRSFFFHY